MSFYKQKLQTKEENITAYVGGAVVAQAGGGGSGRAVVVRPAFHLGKMKHALEMDGCTTLWMYLVLLNRHLRMVTLINFVKQILPQ